MIPGISPNSDFKYTPVETGEAIDYRSPKKVLDQDDFLKLLITQFSTQDPLNPVTDTAFISQMAEFTALENAKETQVEISQMRQHNANQEAISMIGKSIEYTEGDSEKIKIGTVSKVLIDQGSPKLVLSGMMDHESISLDKVSSIQRGSSESQLNNQDIDPERRVQKSLGK
jgi:flagellar basal-body rod modification protein FlgD